MKKYLFLLVALTLAVGLVMAEDEDEGIGLTVGIESGIWDVNKPDGNEDVYPYLMPMVYYDKSFLDGALDVYAELDYTLGFPKINGNLYQDLYFDLFLGYNHNFGEASTLSFLLENENVFILSDEYESDGSERIWGVIRPGLKFNQNVKAGDFYVKLDVPIAYANYGGDPAVGLDYTAGWGSAFGLGLEAKIHTLFAPSDEETGYTGLDLIVSYENGPIYAEVEVRIARETDGNSCSSFFDGSSYKAGVAIIPEFQYNFDFGLGVYVNCAFGSIGGNGDVKISPALGVTYSF